MPSACACSISCLFACILSTVNTDVSVTSAPCFADTDATSCARCPAIARSAKSVGFACSMWPEAPRDRRHVDRRVAAADDHDALADVLQPAVVERLQERRGGDDVGRVAAGHRQRPAGLRAHAEEHRVEVLADLLQRDVGADPALQARLDAEVEDALDLGVEHLARRAEARDAVAHHAAEVLVLVEDGDRVALERAAGRRTTGRRGRRRGPRPSCRSAPRARRRRACCRSRTRRGSARPS